jgi:tRNA (mo5U34)-methyltransferase
MPRSSSPAARYDPAEIRRQVDEIPYWWHSMDVGHGIVTPGLKWGGGRDVMEAELGRQHLPADMSGKTVLDIGSYDGYYAFEAERRGAARVLALDHFAWLNHLGPGSDSVDLSLQYLKPDGLPAPGATTPGKRPFDTARELLGSDVESLVADFMHFGLDRLGSFDIVLYLGVLYHMEEPLRAMRRVAQVTRELAIIESEAIVVSGGEELSLAEFVPDRRLNRDPTNWWVPTIRALEGLASAAGFSRTALVDGPTPAPPPAFSGVHRCRATIHAFK